MKLEKFGLAIAGAAALGACSPEAEVPKAVQTEAPGGVDAIVSPDEATQLEKAMPSPESVINGSEDPESIEQYTPAEKEEILSGTTQEVD